MKPDLTLVFRDPRTANHSIERLFAALEPHFRHNFECHRVLMPCQPSGAGALLANIRHARRETRGVIHITGDAQYLAPFLPRGKVILTIHDCGYLMRLRGLKKLLYKWLWFSLPCRYAAKVTVISQSTREVLEREIGPMGKKLSVVENCVTAVAGPTSRPFDAARPRILQIGSGRHKNLDTLIKAVDGFPCEIKVVGLLAPENRAEMERRGIAYTNEFNVSDERLAAIYHECDILFFASRHEGFGLPILEAQATGIPCITSTCYSMPRVAGGGALLVDPDSPAQIRAAIERLCADPALRAELVRKGHENLRRYQPSAIAQRYLRLYRDCL